MKYDPVIRLNEEMYESSLLIAFFRYALLIAFFSVRVVLTRNRLNDYTDDQKQQLVACCPSGVFEYDETAQTVIISNRSECIFCKECTFLLEDFRASPEDALAVEVKHSTDKFFFTVEGTGALPARDIVRYALQELMMKLKRLQAACTQLNESYA